MTNFVFARRGAREGRTKSEKNLLLGKITSKMGPGKYVRNNAVGCFQNCKLCASSPVSNTSVILFGFEKFLRKPSPCFLCEFDLAFGRIRTR